MEERKIQKFAILTMFFTRRHEELNPIYWGYLNLKIMSLDTTTLSQLKEKLETRKIHLELELGRIAKPTDTPGDYETKFEVIGDDPDENATEVEVYVENLAVEGALESELKDVQAALLKMVNGSYGICEETGKEIPLERLEANPSARTVVEA